MVRSAAGILNAVVLFLLALLIASWPRPLHAQQYLGSISGEVQDATNAKIPRAVITVEENSTHFKTTAHTNGAGAYSVPGLNPGTYTVTASSQGFKTASQKNVTLTVGQLQQVNFNLSLGEATETVEVTGSNSLLDTGSAQIATTLDQQEVTDLPNEGRDPYVQATLSHRKRQPLATPPPATPLPRSCWAIPMRSSTTSILRTLCTRSISRPLPRMTGA